MIRVHFDLSRLTELILDGWIPTAELRVGISTGNF